MGRFFSIGEALVDYFKDGDKLIPKAGGAPANVAVALAKLDMESYFLGALSTDENGTFLKNTLLDYGVKLDYVSFINKPTAYSKVELINGDRKFTFSRRDTADLNYDETNLPKDLNDSDIVHFCSVSLVDSKIKETHKKLLEECKLKNILVSYDVNLRPSLWVDGKQMRSVAKEFISYANIVKMSIEEIEELFKTDNPSIIFDEYKNVDIVLITCGENGSYFYNRELGFRNDHVAKKAIDTTGAGDCFIGAFIYSYIKNGKPKDFETLFAVTDFAANACKVEVSKMGAMEAMPTLSEIQNEMFK